MAKKSTDLFERRKSRTRFHIKQKSNNVPRLSVFRSNKYIYAQVIDDQKGITLCSSSSNEATLRISIGNTANIEASKAVGKLLGERSVEKGIHKVVFDRGGYKFHGRVKALADSAREAGLNF